MNRTLDTGNCRRLDRVSIEKVIVTTLLRGEGTEEDPCRHVPQYWNMEGKFLFEIDEYIDQSLYMKFIASEQEDSISM